MKLRILTSIITLIFLISACKKTEIIPGADYQQLLSDLSYNVILETYKDLFDNTQLLLESLESLKSNQNEVNLELARQAWRNARDPWEQSEGFLFGPVDQKGLDPSIDSWPVNQTDLDAVLKSSNTLSRTYIDGLDGTLKGFHTIEYLLFGENGSKKIDAFTPREFEYLTGCSESLHGATEALYFSWKQDKQNFISNVINAGKAGNNIYPSQKSALEELMTGMITITDEVANGKINDPFSQLNINLEESRFSRNSKKDFADNIRSVKNIYNGNYKNLAGKGLTEIIYTKNPNLDSKIRVQIDEAITGIENIQGTFTDAIFNAKQSVIDAQNRVRALQLTLESEALPIISNL